MSDPNIGLKLGKRTAISYSHKSKKGYNYLFRCECGHETILPISKLKRGFQTACLPCVRKDAKQKHIEAKRHFYSLGKKEAPQELQELLDKTGD